MLHKVKLTIEYPNGSTEPCIGSIYNFIYEANATHTTDNRNKLMKFISKVYPDLYGEIKREGLHVTVKTDNKGGNYLFLQTKINKQYIMFCLFEVMDIKTKEELLAVYRNCFAIGDIFTTPFMPLIIFKSEGAYEKVQSCLNQLPLEDALFINYYSVVMEEFSVASLTEKLPNSWYENNAEELEFSFDE